MGIPRVSFLWRRELLIKDIFPMSVERVRRRSHMAQGKSREFKVGAHFAPTTSSAIAYFATASGP